MPRVELITKVPERDSESVPARSVRRATARRASNRRATARSHQGDTQLGIIDYLAQHPASTAGDLAKGLNLNPGNVSTHLTQLAKVGEIKKASHGYSTQQAAGPRRPQRPLRRSHQSSVESTEATNGTRAFGTAGRPPISACSA